MRTTFRWLKRFVLIGAYLVVAGVGLSFFGGRVRGTHCYLPRAGDAIIVGPGGAVQFPPREWKVEDSGYYYCEYYDQRGSWGRWADTHSGRTRELRVVPIGDVPGVGAPEWRDAVELWRTRLVEYGYEQIGMPRPSQSDSVRVHTSSPIYAGYAWNALIVACLVLAPLHFVGYARRDWRRVLAKHRLERGQCTHCGYDLHGLDAEAACPECGKQSAPTQLEGT